jgi:hypothetical protein
MYNNEFESQSRLLRGAFAVISNTVYASIQPHGSLNRVRLAVVIAQAYSLTHSLTHDLNTTHSVMHNFPHPDNVNSMHENE